MGADATADGEGGAVTAVEVPASITSWQRFVVHRVADEMNLAHFSTGTGDARFITVQRKSEAASSDAGNSMDVSAATGSNSQARRERVLGRCDQMGLTVQTMHRRLPPKIKGSAAEQIANEGQRETNGVQSEAEKLQRWLAWVLKAGHA